MRLPPFPFSRAVGALLCILLLFPQLTACSTDPTGKVFRYDLPGPVENLDPQFTTDPSARLVLANLFEGLVLALPEGDIAPGVAERHTVSPDRLTYTFHLRRDAAWQGGDPLTAEDFVFTFQRIFRDGSPHAAKYAAIQGADALMSGATDVLPGVQAVDAHTLTIRLARPDPLFLEHLGDPAATPCHQQTFAQSRGRYGLELEFVHGNGPFELFRWDSARLSLRKSESYRSELETLAGNVYFYIGRDASAQFADGKTDIAILTREEQETLHADRFEMTPIGKTVWCIVFNQDHRIWGNALLRQGLARAIDHELLGEQAPLGFRPSSVLVPDAMRVMGKPYRELAFAETPLEFDTQQALRLFNLGLSSLELTKLPNNATILIPELAETSLGMNELKQDWQRHLSAYINFQVTTPEEIQTRLHTGEYQMLLMPLTPADANIATLLEAFTTGSSQNYFGYRSPLYDQLLESAAAQPTPELAAEKYAQAEIMLLSDAVVIPLYLETSYLATARGVQDILVSPFGDQIYFKYAQKDS